MAATYAAASMQRIEIVSDRRRAHDPAFRARVVMDSYVPGAKVREVSRRHGICTSLVYRWRRDQVAAATGSSTGSPLRLVPVRLVEEQFLAVSPSDQPRPTPALQAHAKPVSIAIEFPSGVCVRVDESVSQAALRRIVAVLRG